MLGLFLRQILAIIFVSSTAFTWSNNCEDWVKLQLTELPENLSSLNKFSSVDALRSQFAPYDLRRFYLELGETRLLKAAEPQVLPPEHASDTKIIDAFPAEIRSKFLQRIILVSNLDQLTDSSGIAKQWFEDFRQWMNFREADILTPEILLSQLAPEQNLKTFYESLKKTFSDVHRYRNRGGIEAYLDRDPSRFGRAMRSLKYKSKAILIKYKKWIPIGIIGLGVYFVGVDLLRTNLTNEVKYHMVAGRTDLATQVQLALNEKSYAERLMALKDFQGDVKKLHSESARVLASIPGLTPEQASLAFYKLEKDFARYQWATERFLSRTLVQGRGEYVYNQLDFPHSWMQRLNVSYGIFILIRESIDKYKFDIKNLEIQAQEKAGTATETELRKLINDLNKKVKTLELELELHRKQAALILATWKIYEMIFAEYLVKEDGNDHRGHMYHAVVRELGFAFYLETFQKQFEKEAANLGFIFETGKITEDLKNKINLNFTEEDKK